MQAYVRIPMSGIAAATAPTTRDAQHEPQTSFQRVRDEDDQGTGHLPRAVIHPGEDLHDGITFEMFLERVGNHPRCNILYDPSHSLLQQLDYLAFIDIYNERIRAFHVKDAEFNPSGRQGVYSGLQPWVQRAGRLRSPGDGQMDFGGTFSKLPQYGFDGWAILEWECCLKDSEQGAAEGTPFIASHLIKAVERAFDDFAASGADEATNRPLPGLN